MGQNAINEYTEVTQATDIVAAGMDGETMMMRIESGKYYGLGSVGSRIWELISEPRPVAQIIDSLVAEYDVGPEQCRVDTLEFLNRLYEERLIKID